jgi:Tfp pilus assembly protein PilN
VTPLVRELGQSLTVLRGRLGSRPQLAVVCGGGALLRGMPEHLAAQLGIPAARLSLASDESLAAAGLSPEGEAVGALALGLALEHGRRPAIELRQGTFAFRADRSVFRDKMVAVAASVLAVLLFAGISAYAKLSALRSEEAQLEQRLAQETSRVFGQPIRSPSRAAKEIKKNTRGATLTVASHTAADILDTLSRRMPSNKDAMIDVTRLDIKAGKTYVKGTANSQSAVGQIVKALEEDQCFKEVASGKVSAVGDGKREFTLTIVTSCF